MDLDEIKKKASGAGALFALIAFFIWLFSPTDQRHNRK